MHFTPDLSLEMNTIKKEVENGHVIDFESPKDSYNPMNWPMKKKVIVTMLYSFCTMGATWASTRFAPHLGVLSGALIDNSICNEVTTQVYCRLCDISK